MAKNLMHALQYNNYGRGAAVLKHVEVPIPTPNKGEILLKLEATSLNPIDWKIQKGILRPLLPRKFPHIPGSLYILETLSFYRCLNQTSRGTGPENGFEPVQTG